MRRCTGPVRRTRRWCNKCITVHVIWWYSWFFIFHEVINKGWNNWTKEHPNSYISKYFFDFFLSPKIQREIFFGKSGFFFCLHLLNEFLETFSGHWLWSFKWETDGTWPDHLGEAAQSTGNTEQNCVIVHFSHTVVLKYDFRFANRGFNLDGWKSKELVALFLSR